MRALYAALPAAVAHGRRERGRHSPCYHQRRSRRVLLLTRNDVVSDDHAVDGYRCSGRSGEHRFHRAGHGSLRRLDCSAATRRRNRPARADDVMALSTEIPDRCTPHVHEPRERENQKNRHSKEQARLENPMRICDQRPSLWPHNKNTLRSIHEAHHLAPIEMAHKDRDCRRNRASSSWAHPSPRLAQESSTNHETS